MYASRKLQRVDYICPDCNGILRLRYGKKYTPHFVHQKKCQNRSFSDGESYVHLKGKFEIAKLLKSANYSFVIEPYLPFIKQRPDLLVTLKSGQKIAIEFQCSPISSELIRTRTEGFLKHGIQVIWIAGGKNATTYKYQYYRCYPDLFAVCFNRQLYLKNSQYFRRITIKELLLGFTEKLNVTFNNYVMKDYQIYRFLKQSYLKWLYTLNLNIKKIPHEILKQRQKVEGLNHCWYEVLTWLYIDNEHCLNRFIASFSFKDMPLCTKTMVANRILEIGCEFLRQNHLK